MKHLYAVALVALAEYGHVTYAPATLLASNDSEAEGLAVQLCRNTFNESSYHSHQARVMRVPDNMLQEAKIK
jgi:hypothetical protein